MTTASSVIINLPGYPFANLPSVDTIAALRTRISSNNANGDNIAVNGNVSIGDGAGGLYVWSSASTAADNGTSVVRPYDLTSGQAGRYIANSAQVGDSLGNSTTIAPSQRAVSQALIGTAQTGASNTFIAGSSAPIADSASQIFQNSTKSAFDIYGPVSAPGYFYNDTVRSVLQIQPGSGAQHMTAYGAYTVNYAPVGPTPGERNAVGYWALGVSAVDNSRTWGSNIALIDSLTNGAQTLTGRQLIGCEYDFQVNGASTVEGIGLIIQGQGTPANANAVQISARFDNAGVAKWTYGLITDDGAVTNAISIGAQNLSGASVNSQPIYFNFRSPGNTRENVGLQATAAGAINVSSSLNSDSIFLATGNGNVTIGAVGTSSDIGIVISPKGGGNVVANNVISARAGVLLPTSTVAGLPSATSALIGLQRFVVDAGTVTYRGIVAGGGGNHTVVTCDGSNWLYM